MVKEERYGLDPRFDKLKEEMLVFYVGKRNCLIRGSKKYLPEGACAYLSGDTVMLPLAPVLCFCGAPSHTLTAAEDRGGVGYVGAEELSAALGMYLHTEENGLIILSDTDMSDTLDWVKNIRLMRNIITAFSFDDVSGDELLEMIKCRHPSCAHPRLIFTEEKLAAIRGELSDPEGDPVYKRIFEKLIRHADRFLGEPPTEYNIPDGIRLLEVCRDNSNRMLTLAIAYNLTADERYAQGAWRVMAHCCAFPDFNPYHFLDVGEMAACIGLAYDWLYRWLNDEQRRTVREALVEKAIYPIIEDFDDLPRRRSWNWRGELADNWRLVISGVGLSSLAIMDELSGEELANAKRAAEQTLYDIRRALALFAPYGAYEEGHAYWYYAMRYYTYLMKGLISATGTDFGYVDVVGMRLTNRYMLAMNGPVSTFDYHDCATHSKNIPPQMMFLADYFGKGYEALPRIRQIMDDEGTGPLECISDIFLYNPAFLRAQDTSGTLDVCLPIAEVASMRTDMSDEAMWLGFHCDDPIGGEGHDHMDSGSFVLDAMGERFFFDLGRDDYNLPNYLNCYRVRGEGHNVLVINPDASYSFKWGGEARICDSHFTPELSRAVGDLSGAYRDEFGVRSYYRTAELDKLWHVARITDELKLQYPAEIYWFAHTRAEISLSEDARHAILRQNGRQLLARLLCEVGRFEVMKAEPLYTSPVIEGQNRNEGVRKLTVHLEDIKELSLTVEFTELK